MSERQFPGVWADLMAEVESCTDPSLRAEIKAWAIEQYDEHCRTANFNADSEAGLFDEPVFDVQGRF